MKFFLVLPFLLLLFGSSKESSISHKRSIRGLNTTLQTNFNGTYERKNPCTNADIETSSYVACHEFHHHIKEDNWSDYTHKCSAIISSFLQGIGNLVRFNSKQNGTFNFHINTSISQKQDGRCDEKQCKSLPTIVIEANSCEVPPPCKSLKSLSEGQDKRQKIVPAEKIPKKPTKLKPVEKYTISTRCPEEDESTWNPVHDASVKYETLNEGLETREKLQKNRKLLPNSNFTPFPGFSRTSAQAGNRETKESSRGFFNDFSQTTDQNSEFLETSSTESDFTPSTVQPEDECTTNNQNIPFYPPAETALEFEATPQPAFVNDEKLIDNQNQFSRVNEEEIPEFKNSKPSFNQRPSFKPPVISPFESESDQVKKPFKYQQPVGVKEEGEPDFRAPANYEEERFPPAGPSDLKMNPNGNENRPFFPEEDEFPLQQQTQSVQDTDDMYLNTTPYPVSDRQTKKIPDMIDSLRFEKPIQPDSFPTYPDQPETFSQTTEEYDQPLIKSPKVQNFYPRKPQKTVPPVMQYPNQPEISLPPTQTTEVDEYDESTTKSPEVENLRFRAPQTEVPPVTPYPEQPEIPSYPSQASEEYDESIIEPLPVENFDTRTQPTGIPSVTPYPNQPETSFSSQATDIEEYDEPITKLPEPQNFYSNAKPTPVPPRKASQVTEIPEPNPEEFLKPETLIPEYSDELPVEPFPKASTEQPGNAEVTYPPEPAPFTDDYYDIPRTNSFRAPPLTKRPNKPFTEQPFSREFTADNVMASDSPRAPSPDLPTPSYNDPNVLTPSQSTTQSPESSIGLSEREQQSTDYFSQESNSYAEETTPPNDSSPRPEFYDDRQESGFTESPPFDYPSQIPSPPIVPDNQPDVYSNDFRPQPNKTPLNMQSNQRSDSQTYSDDYVTTLPPDSFSPQSKQSLPDYPEQQSSSEVDKDLDLPYPENPEPTFYTEETTTDPIPTPDDYQDSFSKPEMQSFDDAYTTSTEEPPLPPKKFPLSLTKYSSKQSTTTQVEQSSSYSDDYLTTPSPKVSGSDESEEIFDDYYAPITNEPRKTKKPFSKPSFEESFVERPNNDFTTVSPSESFTIYDSPTPEEQFQEEPEPMLPTPDEEVFVKNQSPSFPPRNEESLAQEESFVNEETIPDYTSSRYTEEESSDDYTPSEPFSVPTEQNSNDQTEEYESSTTPPPPVTYPEDDFYPSDRPSTFQNPPQQSKDFEPATYSKTLSQASTEVYEDQNQYDSDMGDAREEFSSGQQPFEDSETGSFYDEPTVRPPAEKIFDRTEASDSEDYPDEFFPTTQPSETEEFTESTKTQDQPFLTYSNIKPKLKSESMTSSYSTPQPESDLPTPTMNPVEDDISTASSDYEFPQTNLPDEFPSAEPQNTQTTDYPSSLEPPSQPPLDYYNDEIPDRNPEEPLMPMDTGISQPTPPASYEDYTPTEEPFTDETITPPMPQTSSFSKSQEKIQDYSPPEPQPQPSYDNFLDNSGDNTRLLASRAFGNSKTTNQYRETSFPEYLDSQEPSNFRETSSPQSEAIYRQSSDEFATTPAPFMGTDIPSYQSPSGSDLMTYENERSQENTGAQQTLLFADNVSPQPQPTTAVKYDEEMGTAQYQTSPAPNPQPQTTLNYANQLYDDNLNEKLPEFYENRQRFLTSEPDFYSEAETPASATISAAAATSATASGATSVATSETASGTTSVATSASASAATLKTPSGATSVATSSTASAATSTSASGATSVATSTTASAATSTPTTANTATATSAATSMSETPFFDYSESFPENEMNEQFSKIPPRGNQNLAEENYEKEMTDTDYFTEEASEEPLNYPDSDPRGPFLPYSNQLRSQPVYKKPPSREQEQPMADFNDKAFIPPPMREINVEEQQEKEFTRDQSEILNNDRPEPFIPYDEPYSRTPDISKPRAPPRMQPQPMPGDYRNDFEDYDWMPRSNERVPANSNDDTRPFPDSEVPPEHFSYPDENVNYDSRELQRPSPQELPRRLSRPTEPRRPFTPVEQPDFSNTQEEEQMEDSQTSSFNNPQIPPPLFASSNKGPTKTKVVEEILTTDIPTAITESPIQKQLAYAVKLLNKNKRIPEIESLDSSVIENRRPFGPPNTDYEASYEAPMNEPFFEGDFPNNVSYPDYPQRPRPFSEQDYAEYDGAFPNPPPREKSDYDEIIPEDSQNINDRDRYNQRRPDEIEQQEYFQERPPQRPMNYIPDREPSAFPPSRVEQQQHSNPLFQTLESQMAVPLQEPPAPSMPNEPFSYEPNYENDSPGGWEVPNRSLNQQDIIEPPPPQPESQLVSDLTDPSNIPDRTTNGRFNYMDRPLRKPFYEDRMRPVSTPEKF